MTCIGELADKLGWKVAPNLKLEFPCIYVASRLPDRGLRQDLMRRMRLGILFRS